MEFGEIEFVGTILMGWAISCGTFGRSFKGGWLEVARLRMQLACRHVNSRKTCRQVALLPRKSGAPSDVGSNPGRENVAILTQRCRNS